MKYEIESAKKLKIIEDTIDTDRSIAKNQLTIKYIGNIDGKLAVGTKKIKKVLPNMQHVLIK
jgi:hypothetical protein